jgi:HK97 family phage prohead protease
MSKAILQLAQQYFAADSIEMKPVKLLLEHDRTRPIGKMVAHNVTSSGIEATFKIANTMAGEDALVEATEGLRDGFSVGAQINEWTNNKGVMQITSATLDEVSLVTDPAIDSARVSEVAASENEEKKDSDLATADSDKPTEGDQVSDTTAPAPAVEEAVEAAKVEAASSKAQPFTQHLALNSQRQNILRIAFALSSVMTLLVSMLWQQMTPLQTIAASYLRDSSQKLSTRYQMLIVQQLMQSLAEFYQMLE